MTVDALYRTAGFITYVPVWGRTPGYLHDLTRRLPMAPAGTMELCNAHAIDRLTADGVEYLHFGFAPFITDEAELPWRKQAGIVAGAAAAPIRWPLYPTERQARY